MANISADLLAVMAVLALEVAVAVEDVPAMEFAEAMLAMAMAKVLDAAGLSATAKKLAFFDKVAVLYTASAPVMALATILATSAMLVLLATV